MTTVRHLGRARRKPITIAALATVSLLLSACGGSSDESPLSPITLKVTSNRADLVSGGDALIEVVLPPGASATGLKADIDGTDVSSAFALRANGRIMALVTGLKVGDNVLTVRLADRRGAKITLTNHPAGGPVFSGTQLQPWVCAMKAATPVTVSVPGTSLSATATTKVSGLDADPTDDQCNAPTKFSYYYQPKAKEGGTCTFTNSGANACFQPYDAANPPADADIATFTNDRDDTAKAIVRVERGTMNRGIYELVTYYDPGQASAAWAPQKGWNGKLLWKFGASSGASRFQQPPGSSVWDNTALSRGFMVASSSLTDHGTNANDTLGAETMMMVKERIIKTYGEIRYTMGSGCSGGSIYQYQIAAAYPGLLDGIQPNCTFPDTLTTGIEVQECGLLNNQYYKTTDGIALGATKQAAINNHTTTGFCSTWVSSFLSSSNPTLPNNCGSGFPAALTYDPLTRPQGVRCTVADHDVALLGTYVDTDGVTKPNGTHDNEGIQYGLLALQNGTISAEEFVRLNAGIGAYSSDLVWKPTRSRALASTMSTVYGAGMASDGRQLAKVAIIDLRGNQTASGDIHANWRAFQARDRLDKDFGNHDNQLIWAFTGGGAAPPGTALALRSFTTLDTWLANIEKDTSTKAIEQKVRANKPADAADLCLASAGTLASDIVDVGLGSAACPVKYQGSPRMGAGGPLAENVFKCQLKPLSFASSDYPAGIFDAGQQSRLAAAFPTGVCDWTKPGVGQQPANAWTTFAAGPGGKPLGAAPVSAPL